MVGATTMGGKMDATLIYLIALCCGCILAGYWAGVMDERADQRDGGGRAMRFPGE
jgi:hypothetical protein